MQIESLHIIYKNLLMTGQLDVSTFRTELLNRGFKERTRTIETPEGPLLEYLLYEPTTMRDLVVVSVKGWVVDARSYESALNLIGLCYDLYERTLGELAEEVVVQIVGIIQATLILRRSCKDVLSSLFSSTALELLGKSVGRTDVMPFGATIAWGIPRPPHEFVTVSLAPPPGPIPRPNRVHVIINYRGVNPDQGVVFVRNLPDLLRKLGEALEKVR